MTIYPVFLPHAACPGRCIYCDQTRLSGVQANDAWAPLVAKLDQMLPEQGQGEIAFYGGSFTLMPAAVQRRLLEDAARFVDQGRCGGIRLSTHPLGLETEHLDLLAQFPVSTVEVGCQSFDDQVLRSAGRGYSSSKLRAGLHRLLDRPWNVVAQLMPGLPQADAVEAEHSLRTVIGLGIRQVRLYPVIVLEGTALADAYRSGRYRPWTLEHAVATCARLWLLCLRSGVSVLRMGLPPLEQPPVAGPWHPAFGQLVRSRLWYHGLARAAAGSGDVEVWVNPADLSDAIGFQRGNLKLLAGRGTCVRLRPDADVPRLCFRVDDVVEKLAHIEVSV